MKLKIKTEIIKEIEIELPSYYCVTREYRYANPQLNYKTGKIEYSRYYTYIAYLKQDKSISVVQNESISISTFKIDWYHTYWSGYITDFKITKAEFLNVIKSTQLALQNKNKKLIQKIENEY